jgi:hypothetical protein
MKRAGKASLFSLSTLLASFFGTAMIAIAFAYFNYKFSKYQFINFKEWIFYEKKDLFKPTEDKYIIILYSSKKKEISKVLNSAKTEYPIIALDYYQTVPSLDTNRSKIVYIKAGTNSVLKFVQRFNIYEVPSIFIIKKVQEGLYKQDSMIRTLDTIDDIKKEIEKI